MTEQKEQKSRVRRYLWLLPVVGLLILAAAVWIVSARYEQRFLPGTRILGVDCSNMTVEQAAGALDGAAGASVISLGDATGVQVVDIPLRRFFDEDTIPALVSDAFTRQRSEAAWYDWFFERTRDYSSRPLEGITTAEVKSVLRDVLAGQADRTGPINARVEITDTGYTLIAEEPGNLVNVLVSSAALVAPLRELDDLAAGVGAVVAEGALIPPAVTADSPRITRVTEALEAYLGVTITLDFGDGSTYTLTREDIRSVSQVELAGSRVVCRPDEALVAELTEVLIADYGVDGVFAKFRHASQTRPYVYYRVGDTGWIMDREGLSQQVYDALSAREDAVIVPDYDYTWYWQEIYRYNRVGDTYIEISLDNQYMWCYLNGELLIETPIVTGNIAEHNDTRRGCFRIAYKTGNLYLNGPTWHDWVEFWMPFDGGIGLHDSSWRDVYGGDIYLTDGSHGCINTPRDAMEVIYANYRVNDYVIVY